MLIAKLHLREHRQNVQIERGQLCSFSPGTHLVKTRQLDALSPMREATRRDRSALGPGHRGAVDGTGGAVALVVPVT